ncbi:MAG: murein biosynthesis integral membrane protein MurJ [Anaerolineales bacterium]|jgi:putative peptidoglycan lipid II flippase
MSDIPSSSSRQIARSSGVVMVGFVLSAVTGLASQILISRAFGTSPELDAYIAGNRLPEILFALIGGGALASAYLPTLSTFITREDDQGAWRLTSAIVNLLIVILGFLSALAWLWAPWIVRHVLAPGFDSPQQIALTVRLLRIMLLSPVVFGVSGLLMATLNAHQHFLFPALAPASYRMGQILALLVLVPRFGVVGLAWGSVLGAVMHLGVQIPVFARLRPTLRLELGLSIPEVRQVGRLMAPRLLGVAVVQLNFLVNTIIASGQPEGSLAALTFAFQLMIMPQAVIAQAIAIAALPTFSAQVARGEFDALRRTLATTVRGVVFLSLPASIGLVLLREPIVALLFERGFFTAESTSLVAWALLWYAAGLLGHALLEVIVRGFYANQDTRTPVLVGAGAMGLNIALSLLLSALFTRVGWPPHGGLALANSLATALEASVLLWLLDKQLNGLDFRRIRSGLIRIATASGALAAVLFAWLQLTQGESEWLRGGVGVLVGLGVYWAVAYALKVAEAREFSRIFLRR